jgi:hypothetical protein
LHGRLEDPDYTDDACLLSQSYKDTSEKTRNLQAQAAAAVLLINSKKTKKLRMNTKTATNMNVTNVVIEKVEQFTYLGSIVTVDGGALYDVKYGSRRQTGYS